MHAGSCCELGFLFCKQTGMREDIHPGHNRSPICTRMNWLHERLAMSNNDGCSQRACTLRKLAEGLRRNVGKFDTRQRLDIPPSVEFFACCGYARDDEIEV